MKRLRLKLVAAVVLPALVVGLWLLSYLQDGMVSLPLADETTFFLTTTSGSIEVVRQHAIWTGPQPAKVLTSVYGEVGYIDPRGEPDIAQIMIRSLVVKGFLGFGWTRLVIPVPAQPTADVRRILIPYWFVTVLSAIPLSRSLYAWNRRHRRVIQGQCIHCGYDLRATPGRCPECGTESNRRAAEIAETDAEKT